MALRIRLARKGANKKPFYRIVVTEATSPRDGKFIEILGHYNPLLIREHPDRIVLKADRLQYWIGVGAEPSDKVAKFVALAGITNPFAEKNKKKKCSTTRQDKTSKEAPKESEAEVALTATIQE